MECKGIGAPVIPFADTQIVHGCRVLFQRGKASTSCLWAMCCGLRKSQGRHGQTLGESSLTTFMNATMDGDNVSAVATQIVLLGC